MNTITRKSHTKTLLFLVILLSVFLIAAGAILARTILGAAFHTAPPAFCTHAPELTEAAGGFSLPDYYITNKVTALNRYYIDDQSDLWGYGSNEYGQLGNGMVLEPGETTGAPVKIASGVVSVDCSVNGYFCIYLTADGELYGMGSNMLGLLGQDFDSTNYYCRHDNKVTSPVLLMDQVAYAQAGMESITALKKDGSVWWWGQYMSTYGTTVSDSEDFEKTTEDESNPCKMLYNSPRKILDNCVYAATGDWTGAAISENGDLYTWGFNIFGECGTPVTEDDFIRTPCKVLEDVAMVWPEQIEVNSPLEEIPEQMLYETVYHFNTFVRLKDGTILAAGRRLGDQEKTISLTGDLIAESSHTYSDTFVPVEIRKYSAENIKNLIRRIEIGTDREAVEQYLTANGIQYFYVTNYSEDTREHTENPYEMRTEDQTYFFFFDSENKLTEKGTNLHAL